MPDWLPAKGTRHPRMFNGNDPRPAYQHANRYPSAAEHNRIACRKTLCKNTCSGCSSSSATIVDKLQTSICHIHSGGLGRVRQKHVWNIGNMSTTREVLRFPKEGGNPPHVRL
jgi:hypothetical protein